MDCPKTRRETKKDQKEKAQGKNGKYSSKHVRFVGALKEKNGTLMTIIKKKC
jgi:hypothetical protein